MTQAQTAGPHPRYTRCGFCSRIYDANASPRCPECQRTEREALGEPVAAPEPPATPSNTGSRRFAARPTAAIAVAALVLGLVAIALVGFEYRGRPVSQDNNAGTLIRPPVREQPQPNAEIDERPLVLKPSEVFAECENCPQMVVVPAGAFVMGSPKTEYGERENEKPQHPVAILRNLGVGRFEVTVRQYVDFLNAAAKEGRFSESWVATAPDNDRALLVRTTEDAQTRFAVKEEYGEHPITFVSWRGAVEYTNWLSRKTKTRYRLLSEAEWEYAARAGSQTAYHFGDDALKLCEYGNVADLAGQAKHKWAKVTNCNDGFADLAPVGKFLPNAFGLHDMIGNAAEWVEDCWHSTYDGAPADGSAWISSGDCNTRVVRGGSFNYMTVALRSAQRFANPASNKVEPIGFRVARPIPMPAAQPPQRRASLVH